MFSKKISSFTVGNIYPEDIAKPRSQIPNIYFRKGNKKMQGTIFTFIEFLKKNTSLRPCL